MYILDTNVLSALRRTERRPKLVRWLRQQPEDSLFLSVVTLGEIERGIMLQRTKNPAFASDLEAWLDRTSSLFADRILAFGAAEARMWGRLSARLGNTSADLLIAATAIVAGATVVTENASDFLPTGVPVENPFR